MKKVLLLGGSSEQVIAINYAKEQGYYTILCDYLIDNPGQYYCDEYHCVSTTDKDAVLELARQKNIDGIVAYSSEVATATAAYVANKLNLPSNPYESVLILSNKNLFRDFLKNNGFNCPKAKSFHSKIEAKDALIEFQFPVMVKPVDSTGSRGVSRIYSVEEFNKAFENAQSKSQQKMVIMEEYIDMAHKCTIGGDLIVLNGKIEYCGFINGYRDIEINSFVPTGNSYPVSIEEEKLEIVRKELQKVIDLLNIKMGVLNLDVVFDQNGRPFIIEMAARNGANRVSQLLEMATGVNLVKVIVDAAVNNLVIEVKDIITPKYYSTYYLHSLEKGTFNKIIFSDEIKDNIIQKVMYRKLGDEIDGFDGLDKIIGILLLEYSSFEELNSKMKNMKSYIDIQIKTNEVIYAEN